MRFSTAANVAVLAIASALGLPDAAQAEAGARVHNGPPAMRMAGPISGQPQQTAIPTQAQGQGSQNDEKQPEGQAKEVDMALVSNLWNASVYGPDNSRIGEMQDIIINSDGKIEGLVVGVGGFLGVGEKNVALTSSR